MGNYRFETGLGSHCLGGMLTHKIERERKLDSNRPPKRKIRIYTVPHLIPSRHGATCGPIAHSASHVRPLSSTIGQQASSEDRKPRAASSGIHHAIEPRTAHMCPHLPPRRENFGQRLVSRLRICIVLRFIIWFN